MHCFRHNRKRYNRSGLSRSRIVVDRGQFGTSFSKLQGRNGKTHDGALKLRKQSNSKPFFSNFRLAISNSFPTGTGSFGYKGSFQIVVQNLA
jgi:hypothetical protein